MSNDKNGNHIVTAARGRHADYCSVANLFAQLSIIEKSSLGY